MSLKQIALYCCCFSGWLLVACSAHEEPSLAPRTVLVYLAGDNNLAGETSEKLEAIARGWTGQGGNLIVYQDRGDEQPRLIELKEGGRFNKIQLYDEAQNSCSPAFFGEVLRQVVARYPARDYGLLYFSHATGWLPQGNYPTPATRTVGMDGTSEMSLTDFAAAIPDGQFRFIVFEACLMAGAEVAYELKDKTQTLVASSAEILSPGFTEIYPQIVPLLFTPVPGLRELAETYFDHWNAKSAFYRSATVSVIHTAGMQALAEQVQPLLSNGIEVTPAQVTSFDGGNARLFSDLGEYLQLKCPDPLQLDRLLRHLQSVVVYQAATPRVMGNTCRSHSGLTVYLPREGYSKLNTHYYQTGWARKIYTLPPTGTLKYRGI